MSFINDINTVGGGYNAWFIAMLPLQHLSLRYQHFDAESARKVEPCARVIVTFLARPIDRHSVLHYHIARRIGDKFPPRHIDSIYSVG